MSDSEKESFGDSDDAGSPAPEVESPAAEPDPVHREAYSKRYAPSHAVKGAWTTRMPAFSRIEPLPFNAQKFGNSEKTADESALEANTIRWTYAAAENSEAEQKVTRISNARIVEWSDGSRTSQLGDEHFEIKTHAQADPTFVVTEQENDPSLATRHLVWESMSFLPTSTSSATHKMSAQALANKQQSGQIRVGSVNTTEDPDKMQREIERAEQAKDKARRKLAAQRDEMVSYTDRSASSSQSPRTSNAASASRRNTDQYDEDSDMIDDNEEPSDNNMDDSDEEDEAQSSGEESDDDARAARLQRIKNQDEPVSRRRVFDDEDSD